MFVGELVLEYERVIDHIGSPQDEQQLFLNHIIIQAYSTSG